MGDYGEGSAWIVRLEVITGGCCGSRIWVGWESGARGDGVDGACRNREVG